MVSQREAILSTLLGIARKYEKAYCYPSQQCLLRLLGKRHKVHISRRTLNRRLKEMESERYFDRIQRHRRGADGGIVFNTTLYKLSCRTFVWAANKLAWAGRLFSFYRVPRLAQYGGSTAEDLSRCGQLVSKMTTFLQKGSPSGAFSTPLKISP